ncbi:restriction endonuclease subunit S [Campylobacter jejuni]|nr:restriction endonuclease subunit S [Campylobacter jejuni]EIU4546853.1 restriction endonuclease subunit S [Campylobacter jejuni]MCC3090507.1 restriction endonuclease subunit S [Campylobacter jejuni]MCC3092745.1 restriction endonuclease subunit S [Campylobacter jejuni]MCC3138281.1 restriction endonuclease subunit S [Campylobacter jejuni]MCG4105418.1 restriction endonuclease subunit S [Campylobacter jejuni]
MKNFKDSGIEWLGEIPQHWEVVKIKFLAIFYTGDSIKDSEKHKYCFLNNSIPYISTKDIDINTNVIDYNNGMFIEKNDANFKRAYTNSILLCLEGANAGKKIAFLDKEVCFVNKLCCISSKTKKLNSKFLFYFLQSVFFKNVFIANIKGLIGGITTDQLGNFYMLFPPLKEQEQIANFLDEKCKKIANFTEKKEKLITLLKEQKQALINETITKGLDKNINFKDSGIEWLGEIPQHWRIVKLKYVAFTNIGLVYTPDDIIENPDEGYPVLRANNIQNGKIDYQDLIYIKSKQIGKKQIISSGDLLMCVRNGSENLLGKTAKIQDGYFSFGAFTAIIKSQFNDYFYWIFQTNMLRKSIASFSASNGIGQISQDDIKNFIISFPPLKEQEQIAQFLDSEISKIDKIIEKTKKQIKLIKEYKTTLINQAVCGRIDL